jgi:hypothetical protein
VVMNFERTLEFCDRFDALAFRALTRGEILLIVFRLFGRDHLALTAQCAHLLRRFQRTVELLLRGVEVQDALRALLVGKTGVGAHCCSVSRL